jgi:Flp pilus assembly protein CpaB
VAIESRAGAFDGLLRPGDRVDVLFTAGSGTEPGSTVTLLQNLLVLSVGGSVAKTSEGGARVPGALRGGSVTLSASVADAQLITQAKERGQLSLTLRNADDIALATGVTETTAQDLRQATLGAAAPRSAPGDHP